MGKWEIDVGRIQQWLDGQDDRTIAYVWAALSVLSDEGRHWVGRLSTQSSTRGFPT